MNSINKQFGKLGVKCALQAETIRTLHNRIAELEADLAKRSEWISVDERLPEHNKTVLICNSADTTTGYYNRGLEQWWFDHGSTIQYKVKHWQPLPSPLEKETP